jgi:hypothetical protein
MGSQTHLHTSNTSYGQKKVWESRITRSQIVKFDFRLLKVRNRPDFLACRWCATYRWKALESFGWKLQLCFRPHLDRRSAHKVMCPQSCENPNFGNQDSHLGVPIQNDIWVLVSWPCTKYTIRGKVAASLKSGPWWVLWVHVCMWLVLAPKAFKLRTNQLVVWFVWAIPTWPWLVVSIFKNFVTSFWMWWGY